MSDCHPDYVDVWLCDDEDEITEAAGGVFERGDRRSTMPPYFAFRVVEVETGEPIEPGTSGRVTVPRTGVYRIETTHVNGQRGRDYLARYGIEGRG